ncbi:ABC transporter substrate-binding protein [Bradyrhizobium yuanmingense]|uniref:ABC transporter substrate-binding protein n=1 Tax=Bradyrhizobium yuanmingense TaxID=108015 RepID=UPI0023B95732|nr:ABC transporter substrate-binding protein [Bradyrhizobium yuanmingense]MDF0581982.1 ABC transporter substrate-binding protein [Bradyrhizobium yuanmingense]
MAGALVVTGLMAGALIKPALAGDQLTVVSWGGNYQNVLRKYVYEPFSQATGIKITEAVYSGEVAKVRAMVESKTVSWDVVDTGSNAFVMCDQGLIETIDWKKLGLDRAKFGDAGKFDCGVPSQFNSTIVYYDKKLPDAPKTIADLFDTKKFPGKRGLWKNPYPALEWALIADGVPKKEVYKVLSTQEGVDRAFKKLDTIKNDVIWWTTGAQSGQLLADGQVIMTAAWTSKASNKQFNTLWDAAQGGGPSYWVIPKGSPHLEEAYKFLAFAGSPQPQADITREMPYGPANRDAMALVDPAVLPELPNTPEHLAVALPFDPNFWVDKGDELRQRFNAWLAK